MPAAFAVLPNPFVLDLAIRLATPTRMSDSQRADIGLFRNAINDKLRDEDVDLSDHDDGTLTDSSTQWTPANSPSTAAMTTPVMGPKRTDVKAPEPSEQERPARRKRKRMSEEERKVRHREVQRQFMKRKRARIAVLRKVQSSVEKQLRLVRVLVEVEMLKKEHESLKEQYEACETAKSGDAVAPEEAPRPAPKTFEGLVFSVPPEETHDDFVINESEWDELFHVLSDQGIVNLGVDSDAASL